MLCKLRTNLQGVKINGFSCFDEQNTNEGHSSAERFNDQGVLHAILCFRTSSCLYKPDETSLVAFLLSLDDSHWYSSLHYSFIVFSRGTCWEPSQTAWWHASWSAGTSGPRDLSILRVASRRGQDSIHVYHGWSLEITDSDQTWRQPAERLVELVTKASQSLQIYLDIFR